MGAKPKKIGIVSWVCAIGLGLVWSTHESLVIFWATSRHPKLAKNALDLSGPAMTDFKREEQKYFLGYGIYVPLEDMMFVSQIPRGDERYADALHRSCSGLSGGGFAIWLPLKTRWPLIGERVSEWCWKPQIQK
jgi:hypothetical protein